MFNTRETLDYEFIKDGCPEERYDPLTNVDDTVATYSTNFVIALVCLAFVVIAINKKSKAFYVAAYLVGTGLSHLIAGVGHVVVKRVDDPSNKVFQQFTSLFNGFGCVFMLLVLMKLYGLDYTSAFPMNVIWWTAACTGAMFVISFVIIEFKIVAYFMILTHVVATCVYSHVYFQLTCCKHCCNNEKMVAEMIAQEVKGMRVHFGIKSVGLLLMTIGMFIQVILAPVCGTNGYKDCYKYCPLPAPEFNHNALFHVVLLVGLIAFGMSEIQLPTELNEVVVNAQKENVDEQGDIIDERTPLYV